MVKLGKMRKEYQQKPLSRADLKSNPFHQFDDWFQNAIKDEVPEANAVVLATVSEIGRPSARTMLLKHYDEQGFVLFTNFNSRKGNDIAANPHAALVFWWKEQVRQVRIEGIIEKAPDSLSDQYFAKRDRLANVGVYASKQSQVIPDREFLHNRFAQYQKEFQNHETVPRPDFWGAYVVIPSYFEFWSGAENRLHDRFCYRLDNGEWVIERLAP